MHYCDQAHCTRDFNALSKDTMMRLKLLSASVIALAGLAAGYAVAQAQALAQAPSLDELRTAVASLRGGRIPRPTSYDAMTPDQKAFVTGILSGPRGDISGSLGVMIVSPVFGDLAQKAIAYARFAGRDGYSSVSPKLTELAIIMGARAWGAQYAWYVHRRAAERAGVSSAVIEAVRDGKRPTTMDNDVEAVYTFCNELLTTKEVSDATFQAAKSVLGGDRGVVDLVGTLGVYQLVAMMMVVDRFPLPEGVAPELKPVR
jgi:4-carboxymuconolactone decarboxylase